MANKQGASISTHEQSISLEDRILNRYEYDAFGNTVYSEEKVHNRFQYTGQQYDPITQQYYLRARYYNPVIARFTQEDTYHGDGLNLYSYCHNNPLTYYDPSGHKEQGCGKTKSNDDLEDKNNSTHMLGENGTQISSKTTWQNGKTERIDVENPAPGERPGQIHYHDANNNKYYYDIDNNVFYDQKTGALAPKSVQKLLKDKDFMKGIKKALKLLGE